MRIDSKTNLLNPEAAFEEAIKNNILSSNPSDYNFAGNFMYMYSKNKISHFKNIITRKYGYDQKTILEASQV